MINCKKKISSLTDGKDYVKCLICNLHGQKITGHLRSVHNLSKSEYRKMHGGKVISDISQEKYAQNDNSDVLRKYQKNITEEQRVDFSKKVSEGILASEDAVKSRSVRMTALNDIQQNDPKFKAIVSATAKKTSARPEIQQQRAVRLEKWREENPEKFQAIVDKMVTTFHSHPEMKLFQFAERIENFQFILNQFVHSSIFTTKSKKKQVDIADKNKRVYIEYDGILHFKPVRGEISLADIKNRDSMLDKHISNHNWTLIRVGYDQYVDKRNPAKSFFKMSCLKRLLRILRSGKPGIYKIGKVYE